MAFSLKKWRTALTKPIKNAIEYAVLYVQGDTTKTVKDNADDIDLDEAVLGVGTFGVGVSAPTAPQIGSIKATSKIVGTAGNAFTVTAITVATGIGTVVIDGATITVEVGADPNFSTAAEVVAYVNEHYLASELVFLEEEVAGDITIGDVATTIGGTDNVLYTVDEGADVLTQGNFDDTLKTPSIFAAQQLLDSGVGILNNRNKNFPVHNSHTIKQNTHAVATWDFAIHGGATGDSPIALTTNTVIPDNAVIWKVIYEVVTELTSTSNTGTIKFSLPTDGDLTDALTASAGAELGIYEGKPGNFDLDGLAMNAAEMATAKEATYIKSTAARKIQAEIATNNLTAGKIDVLVFYEVTE